MSPVPGTEIACQKDDSEVATSVYIMVLMLRFRVGLTLYVIPKRAFRYLRGSEDYELLSKANTLNQAGRHLSPSRARSL